MVSHSAHCHQGPYSENLKNIKMKIIFHEKHFSKREGADPIPSDPPPLK